MINRRRHQQPADASSPDADSRRRANNASIDSASVDEEAGKGKKYQDDLFRSICTALGLRHSNPLSSSGRRRRVSSSLFVLLIVCAILYWPSPRLNRHFERYQKRPTLVMLFDSSYGNAVGDWGYRGSQSRTLYSSSLEPLELSDIPPMYGDITFSSLRSASKFQRRVSPNDYAAYEAIRRQTFERKERKDHTDIYFQHHEETLSLKCQRQNWQVWRMSSWNRYFSFSRAHQNVDFRFEPCSLGSQFSKLQRFSRVLHGSGCDSQGTWCTTPRRLQERFNQVLVARTNVRNHFHSFR